MKRLPDLDVDQVMTDRFSPLTTPRSPEYRRGFRDRLVQLRDGGRVRVPYAYGTVQADAWISGLHAAADHMRWLDERGDLPAA